mgnify:CR=1 FL=1
MPDATERNEEVKQRILKRGRVYDTRGVDTIAVIKTLNRGIRVQYTGAFDTKPLNRVESSHHIKQSK